MTDEAVSMGERLEYAVVMAVLGALRLLPYRLRVRLAGRVMVWLSGPLGLRRRVRANLALVQPDLDRDTVAALERAVPDTIGRVFAEVFSPEGLAAQVRGAPITGDGAEALERARRAGRPVIVVSGHIGNYDAFRTALILEGHRVGALYRPFNNRLFDRRYRAAMEANGGVLFARGQQGMADMVRHLRGGGVLAILIDQHMDQGAPLRFFGRTAMTATSAAELTLRYDAELLPVYGIRRPDGIGFDLIAEAPVAHSDPLTMTQALNDSLERQVRAHMGQWMWTHRRWKAPRNRLGGGGASGGRPDPR